MKQVYPLLKRFRQARRPKKLLFKKLLLPMMALLIISITTTFAQENVNYIYLSGQITNIENGAPVAGHPVYIESNSESPGGLNYYIAAYTDAYGFFTDTITTAALDGTLVIYTFDVNNQEYDREEFFRFNWASEYHMVAGLEIVDPNTITDFQANFDTDNDSLNFDFFDESMGEGIISWFWDFGDGSISQEVNPKHNYNEPGVYDVKLTVSTQPIIHDFRTSTIIKKVYAGMRQYFDFGGHAFAGYFPVDIGTAYLYKIEEDQFIPIDTTYFDQHGYYIFQTLIEGNYKVKAFPSTSSVNAGKYFPTYYKDALFWTKAETINLTETAWEYDIHMVENFEYNTGNGAIDGVVALDGGKHFITGEIEVILFNENDNCLTYIKSNDEGIFRFIELPFGTYKVMAEVPGMYTYPTTITINAENPFVQDLSILVYEEEIPFGIGEGTGTKLAGLGDLYPNPARSHVNFELQLQKSGNVQVFILNQGGQVVAKHSDQYNIGNHSIQLNTTALSSGMYRVMVLFGNEKHVKPFVKVN